MSLTVVLLIWKNVTFWYIIGPCFTFKHIYWTKCHITTYTLDWVLHSYTHIFDRVSRFDTLTVWEGFPWEYHLWLLHSYVPIIYIWKLNMAPKIITELCIMYMCVYYVLVTCIYFSYRRSCVILPVDHSLMYW